MAWLDKGIEPRCGQRECIKTERVCRIGFRLRNRLTARPDLGGVNRRDGKGAHFSVPVDHGSPHPCPTEQPTDGDTATHDRRGTARTGRRPHQKCSYFGLRWPALAVRCLPMTPCHNERTRGKHHSSQCQPDLLHASPSITLKFNQKFPIQMVHY